MNVPTRATCRGRARPSQGTRYGPVSAAERTLGAHWLTWPNWKVRHVRFTPCSLSQREAPFVSTRI
eukprot:5480023-Prymnesium_polylepis.1